MTSNVGVKMNVDKLKDLEALVQKLTSKQVLVGIPASNADRPAGSKINNAEIGYIMETGCPEKNIPARPHLVPAVRECQPRIVKLLKSAATKMLTVEGRPEEADKTLVAIGLIVSSKAKLIIQAKIPPPLADSTLKARARRQANNAAGIRITKGAKAELQMRGEMRARFGATFMPPSTNVTPLIDSGEYISKITYVVRDRTK